MPIFRKGATGRAPAAGSPEAAPERPIDDLYGDADARAFRAELNQGQWQRFHDFIEATDDPDVRFFYVDTLARTTEGRPGWLGEWCAARSASAVPLLFRGTHSIAWAWQARGAGLARGVKEEAWPLFPQQLISSDEGLGRATEIEIQHRTRRPSGPPSACRSARRSCGGASPRLTAGIAGILVPTER